jgi:predicted peptidase
MMKLLLISLLLAQSAVATPSRVRNRTMPVEQVGTITYGISLPGGYDAADPRPLVLALHPGGARVAYYGSRFLQEVVLPGLGELRAVVVAPDCPARSWTDPMADRAVMALLEQVRREYAIDGRRILVTGFSMGGRGTWFMASRHPDLFTGAIVMAGPVGDEPPESRSLIPMYVIHSRDDLIVPFAPAEQTARQLATMGRPIKFEELRGPGHSDMGRYVDALRRGGLWIAEAWKK